VLCLGQALSSAAMGPVGIFDSGVGGLSVLNEFLRLDSGHSVVYIADQAMAPYGERSLTEVRERAVAISSYLIGRGCDVVVVACNSASAAALHHLREVFSATRFVGMEPAVKPAASLSRSGVIGVLATAATFQGELYASVVDRHASGATVIDQACPGLADAIERLGVDATETRSLVDRYVTPLRQAGIDTLVLGCTHYPFVLDAIERAAGPGVTVIDPAPAVARQVLRMVHAPTGGGDVAFLTTGDVAAFGHQIRNLLGIEAKPAWVMIDALTRVRVAVGDLTRQSVDAIVNAANIHLQHGGGVAGAIVRAGGAVTSAGSLPAAHVIHVAGPIYRAGQDNEGLLRAAVAGALDAALRVGARTVALPAISAGIYGYPVAEATAVLADAVVGWLARHPGAIDEVLLVALDPTVAEHFRAGVSTAQVN
jgi:glutamate racemase